MEEYEKIEDAYKRAQELSKQVGTGKVKMKCSKGKWLVWVAGIGAILIGYVLHNSSPTETNNATGIENGIGCNSLCRSNSNLFYLIIMV